MKLVYEKNEIYDLIENINPISYGKSRNFIDGAVTKLSPYITIGILKPKDIVQKLSENYNIDEMEKLIFELSVRDFFQKVYWRDPDAIKQNMFGKQRNVVDSQLPEAVVKAETGIKMLDHAIKNLYETGYVHNHARMWIASLVCNVGQTKWEIPAKWLYYNLLDGDPASNNLSWQWVAGTFSRKKYYANQRNINKYSKSKQYDTFLDIEYHEFKHMKLPNVMENRVNYEFNLSHMNSSELEIDKDRPTLIYSMFGLDTEWHPEMDANRVMVIEPKFLNDFPINAKRLDFIMKCIENNFDNLQLYYGDFESMNLDGDIRINSHPSNFHFKGKHENVNWLFPKTSDKHQSLMQYWRDAKSFVKDLLV